MEIVHIVNHRPPNPQSFAKKNPVLAKNKLEKCPSEGITDKVNRLIESPTGPGYITGEMNRSSVLNFPSSGPVL